MEPSYEVIIIGAGPAGLSAGLTLAKNGIKPIIFDKKEEVGRPVRCGELARKSVFELLQIKPKPNLIRREHTYFIKQKPTHLYLLYRDLWEKYLAQKIEQRGGKIFTNSTVTQFIPFEDGLVKIKVRSGETTPKEYTGKLVIDAEGVESLVALRAGWLNPLKPDEVISCYAARMSGLALKETTNIMLFQPEVKPFYYWIFPAESGQANVGVGLLGTRGHEAKELFTRFIKTHPGLRNASVDQEIVGIAPTAWPVEKCYGNGYLICGATARLCDAYTGEGIYQAVQTGITAAKTVLQTKGAYTADKLKVYRERLEPVYRGLKEQYQYRVRQTP